MNIVVHEDKKIFHLYNEKISYIMAVLPSGQMGQLYFGKRIHDREDFRYMLQFAYRPAGSSYFKGQLEYSLEHIRQEYPCSPGNRPALHQKSGRQQRRGHRIGCSQGLITRQGISAQRNEMD